MDNNFDMVANHDLKMDLLLDVLICFGIAQLSIISTTGQCRCYQCSSEDDGEQQFWHGGT